MFNNLKKLNNGRTRVKVLATLLIMTLTFANFALLGSYMGKATSSYAANINLDNQNNETNNENVKFEVYLDANDRSIKEQTADINSEDLKLYIAASVQSGGQLNNGQIEFVNTNFRLKNNTDVNKFKLDSIQSEKGVVIELPISSITNESFNLSLLNMISQIKLTGEYIDEQGNVKNIEATKMVNIKWTTDAITSDENLLSQEVITNQTYNINGQNKRIIQVLVKSNIKDNKAPIKSTIIDVNVPELGTVPEQVKVTSYNMSVLNNWKYNESEGKVQIEILNNADAENNIKWQKNYKDEFIITYVYDETVNVLPFISNIKNKIELYGRTDGVLEQTSQLNLEALETKGELVKLENYITEKIYKGNMYIGQDTIYQSNYNLYVSYSELADKIIIKDLGDTSLNEEYANTYYKTTKINRLDAINVLGENGIIRIYNAQNPETLLQEINLSAENSEDYFTITYEETVKNILIETTKAVKDGKIEILNEKAIKILNQENISAITELTSNTNLSVKNSEDSLIADMNLSSTASILEPVTNFNISLDKEFLSTQVENNLKITTELITKDISNKLFNNPIVKIELPKEISDVSLENVALLYEDELTIKSSKIITNDSGNKELVIELQGEQTKYNYSTVQSGANIIIDLKVKLNPFMANKNVEIKSTCINGAEHSESVKNIELVSKKGLLIKSSMLSGEEKVEKVNQNNLVLNSNSSDLQINSSIINNFGENINNVSIIGNIPSEGILKEAITTNIYNATIYYSEETNPSENSDSWKTEVGDYNKVKSFKIVLLNDFEQAGMLELGYKLGAKSDIQTNTSLKSNLNINYSINEQMKQQKIEYTLNIIKEGNVPDTPEVPDTPTENKAIITVVPKAMTETLHEGQIITYQINVKNEGKEALNDVILDYTIPEGTVLTKLVAAQATDMEYEYYHNVKNQSWTIDTIEPNETITKEVVIRIKSKTESITNKVILKDQNNNIISSLESDPIKVNSADLSVLFTRRDNMEIPLAEGGQICYIVNVTNNTQSKMNNLTIKSKLPDNTKWIENSEYNKNWLYNREDNTITYKIDSINPGQTIDARFEVEIGVIETTSNEVIVSNSAVILTEDGREFATNVYDSLVLKYKWRIAMEAKHNKVLTEGEKINYTIKVSNIGQYTQTINVIDQLPKEIICNKLTYYVVEDNKTEIIKDMDKIDIGYTLAPGEVLTIVVEGVTGYLDDNIESKQIKNVAKIDLGDGEYIESNTIVNTIINGNPNPSDDAIYSISGMAWLDDNKNGIRDNQENVLQSIKVTLLDKEGKKVADTMTSLTGTYKFGNLERGEYIVVFEYDTDKYTTTRYQVEIGDETNNSDAISKVIQLNNESKLVGMTDTVKIENINISNIDIGLIENAKFDLSLDKYISKVVVTNNAGTNTYDYQDTDLAKIEISAKQLAGSVVLIEYEIKITNEGDVDGYVSDIIDYIPKELTFSSEANLDWYMDSEGNLHNISLTQEPIAAGKTQTVKLVLTRTLSKDSTGTIENLAEIGSSSNLQGLEDIDSIAGNKKDEEDDMGKASLIVSIKTGSPILYIGIVLTSILILGIGIYIIDKKVLRIRI